MRHIVGGLSVLGVVATCSRWSWLDNSFHRTPVPLGLHFFEGWLVFLLLAAVACAAWYRPASTRTASLLFLCMGAAAWIICVLFIASLGISQTADPVWISLSAAVVAFVTGLVLLLCNRKSKECTSPCRK